MPRRKIAERQNERQRIQFAFNADLDSAIGILFSHLLKNPKAPSRAGKHKGVDAMLAYWKPFAYQEQREVSGDELKAIARESVEQLLKQADLIREAFGLEAPKESGAAAIDLRQEVRTAVSEAIGQLVATGAIAMPTQATALHPSPAPIQSASPRPFVESEGVDFDEELLLGNLMDSASAAA